MDVALPDYLRAMVRRAPPTNAPVVPRSTPVVAFGDPRVARVATLGINPSRIEFIDRSGHVLAGAERRLATLPSLGADALNELTDEQVAQVVADCAAYFRRNPYRGWFDPLDRLIRTATGASYHDGSACHLDLVQWATDPTWSAINDQDAHDALLADGVPYLRAQLESENIRIVLVNGRAVIDQAQRVGLVELDEVDSVQLGESRCRVLAGSAGGVFWVGWSTNLQSSFGVTNGFKQELAERVRELCADAAYVPRRPAPALTVRNEPPRATNDRDAACGPVYFVQFPHPGGEHVPAGPEMPWNVEQHRRKFLLSSGQYVDSDSVPRESVLVFWGEWEPPSRVEQRWKPDGRLPRVLHRPSWGTPSENGFRQNTDPWVWGERMIYSNCKQIVGPNCTATSMQRLTRGSVICFGSTVDGKFCLDTLLVIASAEPWVPGRARALELSDAFITCTADSVSTSATDANLQLTLYRGATFDDPVDGTFSFVPALPVGRSFPRFARPGIAVEGLVNPGSRQSTWGSKRPLERSSVRGAWKAIAGQVLDAGLVLAVSIATPARRTQSPARPATLRKR